jgi:non-heme chloroperoxidase
MGSGGTALAVYEHGDAAGPEILFIHGFCQCHRAWQAQVTSPQLAPFRMVSFDLRGHGDSDKPGARSDYDDDRVWADDLAAVISAAGLRRPIVVAWSFGGRVVQDFLRCYGGASIAGINFVSAALRFGDNAGAARGPVLAGDLAAEEPRARLAATRAFLRSCYCVQPSDDEFDAALGYNMAVPPSVRRFILERAPSRATVDMLAEVPLLVSHGAEDAIMSPDEPLAVADKLPHALFSLYDGTGHALMAEAPHRFNAELANFIERSNKGALP